MKRKLEKHVLIRFREENLFSPKYMYFFHIFNLSFSFPDLNDFLKLMYDLLRRL
jgi:hypothetical protein